MNKKQWMTVVPAMAAVMAAMLALVVGVGSAFAADPAQTDPGGGRLGGRLGRHMLGGEVVKIEDNKITVKTVKDGSEKTVIVDDQTKYRKDGKDASLADVTQGEKIGVILGKKPAEGQDPTAKAIIIGQPAANKQKPKPLVGTVGSLNGDTLTVQTAEGDKQVKLPAITQGLRIAIITAPDGSVSGVLYNPPERPQGAEAGPVDDAAGATDGAAGENA